MGTTTKERESFTTSKASQTVPVSGEHSTQPTTEQRNSTDMQTQTQQPGNVETERTGKREATTQQGVERTRTGKIFVPAVDIYETREAMVIVADMPGVDENNVEVNLEKNVLTIYGHVEPTAPAGHTLAYAEYALGDYQRAFTISNAIDWEGISGVIKEGVLKLTLPKAGPAKATKIAVKPE